jgi:hypothetical protein
METALLLVVAFLAYTFGIVSAIGKVRQEQLWTDLAKSVSAKVKALESGETFHLSVNLSVYPDCTDGDDDGPVAGIPDQDWRNN